MLHVLLYIIVGYLVLCFVILIVGARSNSKLYDDKPDWGKTVDVRIPTYGNKTLAGWIIYPEGFKPEGDIDRSNKAVILTPGWNRSKERMTSRARIWAKRGYTTIMISARNHGDSDKNVLGANVFRIAQDVEKTIEWWGEKVVLHGHSIGAGASIINGAHNLVVGVVADNAPKSYPRDAFFFFEKIIGPFYHLLVPGMLFIDWLIFLPLPKTRYRPIDAITIVDKPVMIMYGENDEIFSMSMLQDYKKIKPKIISRSYENGTHSNLDKQPGYEKDLFDFIEKYIENKK